MHNKTYSSPKTLDEVKIAANDFCIRKAKLQRVDRPNFEIGHNELRLCVDQSGENIERFFVCRLCLVWQQHVNQRQVLAFNEYLKLN
jgi:hypothetical protein